MSGEAAALIARLGLRPHPEGGHFVETYRHAPTPAGRGDATAIYYLLRSGEESRWHRVTDAVEVWAFHAGAPLVLTLSPVGSRTESHRLGTDIAVGERPQAVVPAGCWQTARSLGNWTLVSCIVAPAFDYGSFEMAPVGWQPHGRSE
ncbi:MAG TPA: cupin domain-containing protein [Candidatus Angelobacter sp.]|nr:cupin domain-containing protein [Candidatus Angelobacter sp.]